MPTLSRAEIVDFYLNRHREKIAISMGFEHRIDPRVIDAIKGIKFKPSGKHLAGLAVASGAVGLGHSIGKGVGEKITGTKQAAAKNDSSAHGYRKAHEGFDASAEGRGLPEQVVAQWKKKMTPETHPEHIDGVHHFDRSATAWLGTPAGAKWKADKKSGASEKNAEASVSKKDLGYLFKKHEERETPDQEAAESPREQKLEKELGVEKTAFWAGFYKQADGVDLAAKLTALAAGGAALGHYEHVSRKMDAARGGKDYKAKSFIERHPHLTGALTAGVAPAVSRAVSRYKGDKSNDKVRAVNKEHKIFGTLNRINHVTAPIG